nr:MAG TPA: hypothetical protein [Caudoviricetes sp.]
MKSSSCFLSLFRIIKCSVFYGETIPKWIKKEYEK